MSISSVRPFSPLFAKRIASHATGVNVGSVIGRPDPTRGYTRTRGLPASLPLGLLSIGIIGLWLWLDLDVGLWKQCCQVGLTKYFVTLLK